MSVEDFASNHAGFAARYAAMTDGELLELAARSWELNDAAWEALEDELDRRNLEIPPPEDVPQLESVEKRELVLLRRFRDLPEALLAKGKLESNGIESFLADDNMVRMDWFISNLLGGVKVLVNAEDFADAARLLNEPAAAEQEPADAD
jgi:Putative prokaryotic signal transducing protein